MTIHMDMVAGWLREHYRIEDGSVTLLRTLTNEVFRVDEPDATHLLKVYSPGQGTVDEIEWEMDLLDHLDGSSVAAPRCVRTVAGRR